MSQSLPPPGPLPPDTRDAGAPTSWAPPTGPAVDTTPPRRRMGALILMWGGIALMIVGFIGLIGDWAARNYELTQLLTRIEASESAMKSVEDQLSAVDVPADPSPDEVNQARDRIAAIAKRGEQEVASAGDGVGQVSFLPWHGEMVQAQAAYLAHNRAWVSYLDTGSRDPQSLFGQDNMINPTWVNAERAVRNAVPPLAWPTIGTRVDAIFTDDQPDQQQAPDDGNRMTT